MAQDDGVHLPRIERHDFIELLRFLAVALEQTAFEQKFLAVDLDEIHGAGGGARRAEEMDFHVRKLNHGLPRRSKQRRRDGRGGGRQKTQWTSAANPVDFPDIYEM
jgi:hypothetical protein